MIPTPKPPPYKRTCIPSPKDLDKANTNPRVPQVDLPLHDLQRDAQLRRYLRKRVVQLLDGGLLRRTGDVQLQPLLAPRAQPVEAQRKLYGLEEPDVLARQPLEMEKEGFRFCKSQKAEWKTRACSSPPPHPTTLGHPGTAYYGSSSQKAVDGTRGSRVLVARRQRDSETTRAPLHLTTPQPQNVFSTA